MNNMNKSKVGLVFGVFIGGLHFVWSILVAFGWAQPLLNFVFMLHMIKSPFIVGDFNVWIALSLVAITSIIGYVVGYVFAFIWNKLHQ